MRTISQSLRRTVPRSVCQTSRPGEVLPGLVVRGEQRGLDAADPAQEHAQLGHQAGRVRFGRPLRQRAPERSTAGSGPTGCLECRIPAGAVAGGRADLRGGGSARFGEP